MSIASAISYFRGRKRATEVTPERLAEVYARGYTDGRDDCSEGYHGANLVNRASIYSHSEEGAAYCQGYREGWKGELLVRRTVGETVSGLPRVSEQWSL